MCGRVAHYVLSPCDFQAAHRTVWLPLLLFVLMLYFCLHHLLNNVESKSRCLLYFVFTTTMTIGAKATCSMFMFWCFGYVSIACFHNECATRHRRIKFAKTRLPLASAHFFFQLFSFLYPYHPCCLYFIHWRRAIRVRPYFNFSSGCIFLFMCSFESLIAVTLNGIWLRIRTIAKAWVIQHNRCWKREQSTRQYMINHKNLLENTMNASPADSSTKATKYMWIWQDQNTALII